MKKAYIIVALVALSTLISCTEKTNETPDNTVVQETKTTDISTKTEEITGSVVVKIPNNHALAGKTLNFDVEIMKITKGSGSTLETIEAYDSIEVHYTGTLEDGEKFDSSYDRDETLGFLVGAGDMIKGFDAGVVGMELGEKKTMVLSPEEAYGPKSITQTIPKSQLKSFTDAGIKLEVGVKLPTSTVELEIIEVLEK